LRKCNGIISVSTENKNFLLNRGFINKDKVIVLPNTIDDSIFYKRNKVEMRKKFGFRQEDFIVAFVGHFNERKGSLRLSEALKEIKDIKAIFIGRGPEVSDCPGILYCGGLLSIIRFLSI
jgi:glycosyltransferase involved in cell wall biosynthesis